jgi:hypothetical protein
MPNVRRGGVLHPQGSQSKNNIFGCIDKHKKFSYALEMAYRIVQNMPKDVRKDFMRACEEIK